jgi:transposase
LPPRRCRRISTTPPHPHAGEGHDGGCGDHLRAHKVAGVTEAIAAAGATLRYLPQYSPDLNPIEMPYSKFKAYMRKLAERTGEGVRCAIRSFLPSLKGRECANDFRHAGYASI